MSQFAKTGILLDANRPAARVNRSAIAFCAIALAVAAASMGLAGWAPLGFSIVTVFLFAGPHNWFEFRYFLSRMPARWGPRRHFFTVGIVGAFSLAIAFALQSWLGNAYAWSNATWLNTSAVWSSLFVVWIATMIWLRGREREGRDWSWCWAATSLFIAVIWMFPMHWSIAMVYLHPLVALWFLRREIKRNRPHLINAYRVVLVGAAMMLIALWWQLADAPNLAGDDGLSLRITNHAGGGVLTGISTHLLVATHTFMEMLHYAVWMIAIPLISLRKMPWNLSSVPIAGKSVAWRRAAMGIMLGGALIVLVLWIGFAANYPLTRDVYFTIAILHVLAEFPFIIRSV